MLILVSNKQSVFLGTSSISYLVSFTQVGGTSVDLDQGFAGRFSFRILDGGLWRVKSIF